jgi:hypothetical protein
MMVVKELDLKTTTLRGASAGLINAEAEITTFLATVRSGE